MEEPGGLQSMLRVRHDCATSLSLFTFMHWRRKWQPSPVFLPGESQGRGSLMGCRLMGSHRVGHDWSDLAAAAASPKKSVYFRLRPQHAHVFNGNKHFTKQQLSLEKEIHFHILYSVHPMLLRGALHACSLVQSFRLCAPPPTRLLCPWDFPGKNTGVSCHFLRGSAWLRHRTRLSCVFSTGRQIFYTEPPGKPEWCFDTLVNFLDH